MSSALFSVTAAGPHVTFQDAGRDGMLRFGVPTSGPMDRASYAAAQAALGNPPDAASIEISPGGLSLSCLEGEVTLAVAGGGFQVVLDGARYGAWTVLTIRAGSVLLVRPGFWGCWTYLAFAGHLQVPPWLGSISTHGPTGLGGGRLAAGQFLTVTDTRRRAERFLRIPLPAWARPPAEVPVVLGPQDRFFAPETVATLLREPFTLSEAYDRMGVRLRGPALPPVAKLDMPSEPVARGSIQVSGDAVPTVLLADHQSTGGYPKIATVVSTSLDRFVQLRSRQRVMFRAVSAREAVGIVRSRDLAQQRYLDALRQLSLE
ncbi:5-oxoprolinase subunit C family protein [Teichococcus vastitatis]|jgi:allophanate hydrolase|uniref:5-oxoprolinase subunit C family protein n=1 Tax=Teichococcus vastitatis TaxID=2307076 RepID=UPI000E7176EF|nr:biotin-dependent carboxyltransferase family protein [Pseudoroseomonas vastitatis]